ncbi:MAG TPA: ABC transporter ATP-binding protein [Chitinophagaceae bacterium]|nr:ABC transporter ATP-binding protein [Chitinophagaceae bacterium]
MKASLKKFIKKYFSSFAFFYSYLRNKIFIAFALSIAVSFLDGMGLTMFLPLLQVVGGEQIASNSEDMGNMAIVYETFQKLGIPLSLLPVLLIMILFFVLKGIATYINSIYRVILQQSFVRKVRLDLLNSLNRMSYKKFILADVGRIQNTMTGEVMNLSNAFVSYFQTFQQALMLLVYIGFAFFLDPKFALLVSLGGGLTHILYHFIYKSTKKASIQLTKNNSMFQGFMIQHIANFKYLKATGRIKNYGQKLEDRVHEIEGFRKKMGYLTSISEAAREPLLIIIICLVMFIQVQYLGGNIGTMLISLMFFYRGLIALVGMQQNWNRFLQVSGSMENMLDFQDFLRKNLEKDGKERFEVFKNSIVLKNVDFYYGASQILKNINFSIPKNTSIAFVGESGSGKTTLVNLISGLIPEDAGEITVDGIVLKNIKKSTYQNRIGYVSQDAVIFNDTIFNNITFWAEKTEENLRKFEKAITQAALSDLLVELPEGMETELGNNGINLSGGQKQRISIARELYKDIDILILDEATSALDSETEKEIQESIDALQGKYTILMIAHRLSTIRNVDQVVLMDKGKIVDVDTFENLVQNQDRFRKMVELQEL